MSAKVLAAKRHSVYTTHKVFKYKKPEDRSRFVLRRKALETFVPCPLQEVCNCRNGKIINRKYFSKNAQFFVEACKKFIEYPRHSNNSSYILFHSYCNLIMVHAAFFCDPIVCYLGFLAVISNTQVVQ